MMPSVDLRPTDLHQRKILVCSSHAILTAGFRTLIAEPHGLAISECTEAQGLQTLLETDPPDLVLIDVNSGFTLHSLTGLSSVAPNARMILWVDWISPEFVRQAITAGVRGILNKDASPELYAECLRQVAAGQFWLEQALSQRLLSAKSVRLSPRERQLVGLLTQGLRNKEIAVRMNITEGTTKVYLTRLFEKTGASDRFELAMFALQNLETDPASGPSRGPRAPLNQTWGQGFGL